VAASTRRSAAWRRESFLAMRLRKIGTVPR